jgi:hypothetical protein
MDDARDTWVTTRLRSALTFDPAIKSLNYTIETVNGVVYLIGSARGQGELDRVTNHARNLPNVRKVVTYVDIRPGEPRPVMPATAPPPADAPPAGSWTAPPPADAPPAGSWTAPPPADPGLPPPAPLSPPSSRPAPIEARPLS